MFDVKLRTNFTFEYVSKNYTKMYNDLINDVADNLGKNIKKNILDSPYKPLKPSTIKARRRGKYWDKERVSPTDSIKPLIQTGSLLGSIKHNKSDDTVTMNHYGWHHNTGFTAGGAKVPRRPFISDVASHDFTKFYKLFRKMLNKQFRFSHN